MGLITYQGTVTKGQILLPASVTLPDGAVVLVTVLDEWTPTHDDIREAELLGQSGEFRQLVERAMSEVENGQVVNFEDMLSELSA
jgi:hypothetical protein